MLQDTAKVDGCNTFEEIFPKKLQKMKNILYLCRGFRYFIKP